MVKAIHQFVAGYSLGDAISNETRVMQRIFKKWGYASHIYCDHDHIMPSLRDTCGIASEYEAHECDPEHDLVLLHFSIGSKVNEVFRRLPCKKALLYHNITPPHFFKFLNPEIAKVLEWGRNQMPLLKGVASVNLADSAYNANELEDMGYGDVDVLPLVLDLSILDRVPDDAIMRHYQDGTVNVFFCGRCAPNKALEDILHAFYYFQKFVEPNSRFIHVGSSAGTEEYLIYLNTLVTDLDLNSVIFHGASTQAQLNAFYKVADLFLCMSEHEGFGIPIIEAMYMGVPVMGYDCTAVADTMGGAGVVIKEKNYPLIAEMMGELVRNQPLRSSVIAKQNERIQAYQNRDLEAELKQCLSPLLNDHG